MSRYTPMLRQYLEIKKRHQDCILFFRLGDFYEMFFDDALYAAEQLNIVLTAREGGQGKKIPMCGVPYHSAAGYIQKLIAAGQRVAICEQIEDAKEAKGLVKRDVVRIITPGTMADGDFLAPDQNNFLMSIYYADGTYGYGIVDVSTGFFRCGQFDEDNGLELLIDEFMKYSPAEIVTNLELTDFKELHTVIKSNNVPVNKAAEDDDLLDDKLKGKISFQDIPF